MRAINTIKSPMREWCTEAPLSFPNAITTRPMVASPMHRDFFLVRDSPKNTKDSAAMMAGRALAIIPAMFASV